MELPELLPDFFYSCAYVWIILTEGTARRHPYFLITNDGFLDNISRTRAKTADYLVGSKPRAQSVSSVACKVHTTQHVIQ